MSTRLVKPLVVFECNADVLKDGLSVGDEKGEIILLPHNDHLMITNYKSVYSCFKLMSKDCFFSYKMNTKVKEEWFTTRNVKKLKAVVVPVKGINELLSKIKRVKITIEEPEEGEIRYIHIEDMVGEQVKFSGKIKINEREINADRLLARFVEYYDSEGLMVPKPALAGSACHILKIKEGLKFTPIITSKDDFKQFITTVVSLNPDEFEVQVFNSSATEEYTATFMYDFLMSTDEEKLQKYKDHSSTFYRFPANPKVMELVLKYQSVHPNYLVIVELEDDDDLQFYVFFCSLKDMGDAAKIYTTSLMFLEGEPARGSEPDVKQIEAVPEDLE